MSENRCSECKYKGHCDETSRLYGVPKWNGGCTEFEKKNCNKCGKLL